MNEYNDYRREFLSALADIGYQDERIGLILDRLSFSYTISRNTTELIEVHDKLPSEVNMYLATKKIENKSSKTINIYMLYLMIFFRYVQLDIHQVKAEHIRLFLYNYQQNRGVSNRTLDYIRSTLCNFFRWCYTEGYISQDPSRTIKKIKYEAEHKGSIEDMDLEKIRSVCKNKRERAFIELLYSTGCRIEEVSRICIQDIDFENGIIVVFGKGSKHRQVYLTPRSQLMLVEYIDMERKGEDDHLFLSDRSPHHPITTNALRKMFDRILDRVGLKGKYTPHSMRHTTATHGMNRGMSPVDVMTMLGHVKLDTTLGYTDIRDADVQYAHRKYIY